MITRKMRKAMKAVAKANGITEAQAVTEIENLHLQYKCNTLSQK